jgi:hypothetical protein
MMHEFELLGVRKNMASSEIHEIDNKIANLHGMRRIIMERLAGFEQEEAVLEHDSTWTPPYHLYHGLLLTALQLSTLKVGWKKLRHWLTKLRV